MPIEGRTLAVVIPAYQAEKTVQDVIRRIPWYADWIIVTDDASTDGTVAAVRNMNDKRVVLVCHEKNTGVGGAMMSGFTQAVKLGATLIAKIDADGQMDPQYLDRFARMCLYHGCDYVKANRFGHLGALPSMPRIRFIGSIVLSFLTKISSGCWNVFDPQNGYVMITRRMLLRLDWSRIDRGYFFENSMMILLNIVRAKIGEIYLPASYGAEQSSMKLTRIMATFPVHLCSGFLYRIYQKYVFRSLSPFFLLLVFGLIGCVWGGLWGGWIWFKSYTTGIPSTTGAVVLALLPLIVGWSTLLQAFVLDIQDAGPCLLFDFDDETLKTSPRNNPTIPEGVEHGQF
jgi:glycosyltransferase involved in cell wall biosynthesis